MNTKVSIERARIPFSRASGNLPTVHVADEDAEVRAALSGLLGAAGAYQVQAHSCAADLLAAYNPEEHGCFVLDIGLPGLGGTGPRNELHQWEHAVATVYMSNRADVRMCADVIRRGAVDFLTKPLDESLLLAAVSRALARDKRLRALHAQESLVAARLATLTSREREVISHVAAGRLNKQIAGDLGITERTVKVHRARGLEKLRVSSVAELVRLVDSARPAPDPLVDEDSMGWDAGSTLDANLAISHFGGRWPRLRSPLVD